MVWKRCLEADSGYRGATEKKTRFRLKPPKSLFVLRCRCGVNAAGSPNRRASGKIKCAVESDPGQRGDKATQYGRRFSDSTLLPKRDIQPLPRCFALDEGESGIKRTQRLPDGGWSAAHAALQSSSVFDTISSPATATGSVADKRVSNSYERWRHI
jgi:hypothetical protein